jgi:hypothetical protein
MIDLFGTGRHNKKPNIKSKIPIKTKVANIDKINKRPKTTNTGGVVR